MTFTLRLWDFDMDSAVLGPIRCAHLDASKKFAEFEEQICAGTVDSTELARDVFKAVAHRRTGDFPIDAKCGGAMFSEEEVSMVPSAELDLFCDKLVKGRLILRATAAGAEPPPAAPALQPGRGGLASALRHVAETDRAAWKRMVEATGRSMGNASYLAAQMNADKLSAAVGGDTASRAMREIRGAGEIVRGPTGSEDLIKSALGRMSMTGVDQAMADIRRSEQMTMDALGTGYLAKSALLRQSSMTAVDQAMADIRRSDQMFKDALGIDYLGQSILGQSSAGAALEAAAGIRSVEEVTRRLAMGPNIRDLAGMDGAQVVEAAPVRHLEFTPIRMPPMPPNPIHQTNEIVGQLLAHQKSEAAKKDAERSEAKVDSGQNKEIAESGLRYTKRSFWVSVIASFVIPAAGFVWTYYGKADALDKEKKSAVQVEELRAEIHALKASKRAPAVPAKPLDAHKPGG